MASLSTSRSSLGGKDRLLVVCPLVGLAGSTYLGVFSLVLALGVGSLGLLGSSLLPNLGGCYEIKGEVVTLHCVVSSPVWRLILLDILIHRLLDRVSIFPQVHFYFNKLSYLNNLFFKNKLNRN